MNHICIICGRAGVSLKDILPATLAPPGNGTAIYCDEHVAAYSSLIDHFSSQLDVLNALAGVRPFPITRHAREQVVRGALALSTRMGSAEGLRAIAYVLQTYFARYFGEIARSAALDELKHYTLGETRGVFVWWDTELPADYPHNAFSFGHRIAVGVDPDSGQIFGRLSLFSTFHFAATLGIVSSVEDRPKGAVMVDIDPLTDLSMHSVFQSTINPIGLIPQKPVDHSETHAQSVVSERSVMSLARLIANMYDFRARRTASRLVEGLSEARANSASLDGCFSGLHGELTQHAFHLLQHAIDLFVTAPEIAPIEDVVRALVLTEGETMEQLSPHAKVSVHLARDAIVTKLAEDFIDDRLTSERAFSLIAGDAGVAAIIELMLVPVVRRFTELI